MRSWAHPKHRKETTEKAKAQRSQQNHLRSLSKGEQFISCTTVLAKFIPLSMGPLDYPVVQFEGMGSPDSTHTGLCTDPFKILTSNMSLHNISLYLEAFYIDLLNGHKD
jgi:hypothetical protein